MAHNHGNEGNEYRIRIVHGDGTAGQTDSPSVRPLNLLTSYDNRGFHSSRSSTAKHG